MAGTSIAKKAVVVPWNKSWVSGVLRILAILLMLALAWGTRSTAVNKLPIDYDEDDYLRAGQEYASLIRSGDWAGFMQANYRTEHPPLAKIIIGLSLLSAPEEPLTPEAATSDGPNNNLPRDLVKPARTWMAVFGTLTVGLLALVNPLAAFLLSLHTFTIKYVSQIMLEAFPALTSFICVLAYLMWKKRGRASTAWLVLSAVFLGLTAASKYLYCVVSIAILVDGFIQARSDSDLRRYLRFVIPWGLISLAIFFAADPYLWPDPIGRLTESVFYHAGYASGAQEVQNASYPAWQPLYWLMWSPFWWHRNVFVFPVDILISLLAIFGIRKLWGRQRLYVLWLGIALLFLFLWPTKWPQYIITLTVPLSLASAEGLRAGWEELLGWWQTRKQRSVQVPERKETRRAMPWLVPGLAAFALLTLIPLVFQLATSMTDFNTGSLRDGLNGGIWRALWGGLTGQLPVRTGAFDSRSNQVNFTALTLYGPVLDYIVGNGILFFNIFWTFLSVGLQAGLGVAVALLLWQKGIKLGKFWQALFILPWAIPEMIGALMWSNIFQPTSGWLPLAAQKYGAASLFGTINTALNNSSSLWLLFYLLPAIWYGFPFMMLAASIGLKAIPRDVFDASAIDGASPLQTFRFITWPLLLPMLVPALIVRGIFSFNQFYLFQIFGYGDATLAALSYNIFNPNSGFGNYGGQFAFSAVINILTVLILLVFVVLFNRWSHAGEGVAYA